MPEKKPQHDMSNLDIAAYLLDRADQYETDSPCWVALSDAAANVANGDALASWHAGELDDEQLRARVERMDERSTCKDW